MKDRNFIAELLMGGAQTNAPPAQTPPIVSQNNFIPVKVLEQRQLLANALIENSRDRGAHPLARGLAAYLGAKESQRIDEEMVKTERELQRQKEAEDALKMQIEMEKVSRMGGFTLQPGQRRYDASGNVVAEAPGGGLFSGNSMTAQIANMRYEERLAAGQSEDEARIGAINDANSMIPSLQTLPDGRVVSVPRGQLSPVSSGGRTSEKITEIAPGVREIIPPQPKPEKVDNLLAEYDQLISAYDAASKLETTAIEDPTKAGVIGKARGVAETASGVLGDLSNFIPGSVGDRVQGVAQKLSPNEGGTGAQLAPYENALAIGLVRARKGSGERITVDDLKEARKVTSLTDIKSSEQVAQRLGTVRQEIESAMSKLEKRAEKMGVVLTRPASAENSKPSEGKIEFLGFE